MKRQRERENERERERERSISAGVYNDIGSGSNVDLCVISDILTKFIFSYGLQEG